jgi:hypothetical protein
VEVTKTLRSAPALLLIITLRSEKFQLKPPARRKGLARSLHAAQRSRRGRPSRARRRGRHPRDRPAFRPPARAAVPIDRPRSSISRLGGLLTGR